MSLNTIKKIPKKQFPNPKNVSSKKIFGIWNLKDLEFGINVVKFSHLYFFLTPTPLQHFDKLNTKGEGLMSSFNNKNSLTKRH